MQGSSGAFEALLVSADVVVEAAFEEPVECGALGVGPPLRLTFDQARSMLTASLGKKESRAFSIIAKSVIYEPKGHIK